MKLSVEQLAEEPLLTNRLKVTFNQNLFFKKYAIIRIEKASTRCFPYSQLKNWNIISLFHTFKKGEGCCIYLLVERCNLIQSMQELENQASNNLCDYQFELKDQQEKEVILVSLLLNSLPYGPIQSPTPASTLILKSNKNFMEIRVNSELNITASSKSIINRKKDNTYNDNCKFYKKGTSYTGSYQPGTYVIQSYDNSGEFVSIPSVSTGSIEYWNLNRDKYVYGKFFALKQIVENINHRYKEFVKIEFRTQEIFHFDTHQTKKSTDKLILDYLKNARITILNSVKTEESIEIANDVESTIKNILSTNDDSLQQPQRNFIVNLCLPKPEKGVDSTYISGLQQLEFDNQAIQHITIDPAENKKASITAIKRILMELAIKDMGIKKEIPQSLSHLLKDWKIGLFREWRTPARKDTYKGGTLSSDTTGNLDIEVYGMPSNPFQSITSKNLKDELIGAAYIDVPEDILILKSQGNIFQIEDTRESSMIDVDSVIEKYSEIQNNCEERAAAGEKINGNSRICEFKRIGNAHRYFRGYIGLHMWKNNSKIRGYPYSYSYISGINPQNINTSGGYKIEKLPLGRTIHILRAENPEIIEAQILQIVEMLKVGFGRIGEMMTYPFPFKILGEFLERECLAQNRHWYE